MYPVGLLTIDLIDKGDLIYVLLIAKTSKAPNLPWKYCFVEQNPMRSSGIPE